MTKLVDASHDFVNGREQTEVHPYYFNVANDVYNFRYAS